MDDFFFVLTLLSILAGAAGIFLGLILRRIRESGRT